MSFPTGPFVSDTKFERVDTGLGLSMAQLDEALPMSALTSPDFPMVKLAPVFSPWNTVFVPPLLKAIVTFGDSWTTPTPNPGLSQFLSPLSIAAGLTYSDNAVDGSSSTTWLDAATRAPVDTALAAAGNEGLGTLLLGTLYAADAAFTSQNMTTAEVANVLSQTQETLLRWKTNFPKLQILLIGYIVFPATNDTIFPVPPFAFQPNIPENQLNISDAWNQAGGFMPDFRYAPNVYGPPVDPVWDANLQHLVFGSMEIFANNIWDRWIRPQTSVKPVRS